MKRCLHADVFESRLGNLLVRKDFESFLHYVELITAHPRITARFFSSPQGLGILLLMTRHAQQLGVEQTRAIFSRIADKVDSLGKAAIAYYGMRLYEAENSPEERELRRAAFKHLQYELSCANASKAQPS